MATDYKKIKPIINLRSIRQSSDKTHFIYELIQNAYDSKSRHLELHLHENELLVWNDGDQFSQEDVHRICSIGFSAKDLTQVGHYGIGFKTVYNYTDRPEVYSGDERFCIPDPTSTRKTLEDLASSSLIEGIDEVPPRIAEQINKGRTVFRLPFRDILSQDDITLLKNQLRDLDKRVLLFLQDFEHELKSIQWHDERDGQIGYYFCSHSRHGKIQKASEAALTISLNGKNQLSETFLVFRKEVQPRQDVVDKLLQQAEDDEKQRIQKSAEKKQPIEVAFKLHEDRIIETDNSVLFAYLPTEKETHLQFLIQARYQTTPARDNIVKSSDSPWNKWLVQETADFLLEILEQLKVGGLLEPAFFNVLPLKGEVENEFKPIADALQKAMQERAFVPTQDGGYAKAENVFYPHHGSLRKLVECSWIYPESCWLHPDIGQSGRVFEIMKEARVKEINVSQVLNWLKERDSNWFENRDEAWLRSLYVYLKDQKSHLEQIKQLRLIRLENGRHVCASDALVFFPPEKDEEREEIAPFLNELPILQSDLLEGDERSNIEGFLKDLGVLALNPADLIGKWIIPRYAQPDKPSVEENQLHVRYLFKVWDKLSGNEHRQLKEELSKVPILRAYNGVQPETYNFVKPCNAYLPKAYTGDVHLETYFSLYDGDIWFVDGGYLDGSSNLKKWIKFLRGIEAMDTLRVDKIEVVGNYEECEKRGITRKRSTRRFKDGYFIPNYYSGHFDGAIEDFEFAVPFEVFNKIGDHDKVNLSRSLWTLLVKAIEPLSPEKKSRWPWTSSRDAFFQGTYHWFYQNHRREFFDATFYRQLQEIPWLPDEQGNFHRPSKCFAPTDDNRNVLGDSVAYLHPDFDVSQDNEVARWLAKKLEIRLNANTNSVVNYLQTLSGTETSVEKVEPLYRFLARQDARRSEEFKQKPLIFTSNPEPRWWKSDEVFWEDERPVFGNRRGYLKENYADHETTLKPFFIAVGVSERASPSDYVRVIREVASVERTVDEEIRERVKILYSRLWQPLQEGGSWQEDEEWQKEWNLTREGRCWLGKKGDEWDFFFLHELVWKDDDYRSQLFKDKISFWAFDNDLLEFAKYLGVKGCYEISDVKFKLYNEQGQNQVWSEEVRNLHPYVHDFLRSPNLRKEHEVKKSAEILDQISVCQAERLKVEYKLNGFPVPDPNPRQSFLDEKNQILWLGLEEDEKAYPDLIGDALQDYFRIDQLREFVKDLLPSINLSENTLLRWKQRGFQPDHCLSPPELDSEVPDKTGNGDGSRRDDSEPQTPTVHEDPETGNENDDSISSESITPTHRPRSGRGGARWPGGSGSSTPNRSTGTGYGGGGPGEGEKHRSLKKYLAANPSLFGEGLELIGTEYRFGSGDEADILFEDSSGNPVTVEVKPPISSGSDQEVWQAVKYKHLAAVEYDLPCEEIRSILAAPEIPDDVKEECKRRGIEPFEATQR